MRPPFALSRCVRIAFLIAELVMDTMSSDPEDGTALEGHGGEDAHGVLDPLRGVIPAVGQQAVITHAYSHIDSENVQNCHNGQPLPAKKEECGHRADVKDGDGSQSDPVKAFFDRHGLTHACEIPGG